MDDVCAVHGAETPADRDRLFRELFGNADPDWDIRDSILFDDYTASLTGEEDNGS